jgi:hypothetical protein
MPANLYDLMQQQNLRMVEMVEKNHSVASFIQGLCEYLVNYANHKGLPIEAIDLDLPFIGDDEYIRARIRVNPTYLASIQRSKIDRM